MWLFKYKIFRGKSRNAVNYPSEEPARRVDPFLLLFRVKPILVGFGLKSGKDQRNDHFLTGRLSFTYWATVDDCVLAYR